MSSIIDDDPLKGMFEEDPLSEDTNEQEFSIEGYDLNPLNYITNLIESGNVTKKSLSQVASDQGESLSAGGQVLFAFGRLKVLKEYISALEKELEDEALDIADQYGDDKVVGGLKFQIGTKAGKYTYDHDPKYCELKKRFDLAKKDLDEYMEAMKKIIGVAPTVMHETLGKVHAAKKSGGTKYVSFPIKKG